MTRTLTDAGQVETEIRARVRLDFKGVSRPGRLFFGSKPTEKVAEENREQQIALFRNVPIQGVRIEDISLAGETYVVFDDEAGSEVAYAPAEITLVVDSFENLIRFVARDDFRRIEILEPGNMLLNRLEIERLLFRINEEVKSVLLWFERKYSR